MKSRYKAGEYGYQHALIAQLLFDLYGRVETGLFSELAEKLVGRTKNSALAGLSHWKADNGYKHPAPPINNGVHLPREGTIARKIYLTADALRIELGDDYKAILKHMIDRATENGFNLGNVKTEMSRWRRFRGI